MHSTVNGKDVTTGGKVLRVQEVNVKRELGGVEPIPSGRGHSQHLVQRDPKEYKNGLQSFTLM